MSMAVPSVMSDLSVTANSNSPAGSESPISTDDFLRAIQSILRHTNAKGADIASATTTDIGAATGEFVDVTGTTTITGLGTIAAGIERTVRFTGALTLTHNATSLILPGGANITTAANDTAVFRSLGSGNWICIVYKGQSHTLFSDLTMSSATVKLAKGADVASASALTLITDGNYFDVTGTTTVTSFNSVGVGTVVKLHFDDALILTHHATDLILPGAANITTAAGDEAEFIEYASGDWRCVSYQRADGSTIGSVIGTPQATTSGTTKDFSIPAWAKEIIVNLRGVSTNGTSGLLVQLGDSGGAENTGYNGAEQSSATATAYSAGFLLFTPIIAGASYSGSLHLSLENTSDNTWNGSSIVARSDGSTVVVHYSAGYKSLSNPLTTVRVTTVSGDTLDLGEVNVTYRA